MKKRRFLYLIAVFSTAVFLILGLFDPLIIKERIETLTLDYRFHIRNRMAMPPVDENIIIVAVDEKSLRDFGRWPWSRTLQGRLIEQILGYGPKVLAVDIFWSEPESKEADAALREVINKGKDKLVIAAAFDAERGIGALPPTPEFLFDSALQKIKGRKFAMDYAPVAYRVLLLPAFGEDATVGNVYSKPDMDGKLRKECLYIRYEDDLYPSLALQTAAKAMGKSLSDMTVHGGSGVSIGDYFVPTDFKGKMLINYPGGAYTYKYVSAGDVLKGKTAPGQLKDKIVLLGTSAIATYDTKASPFSEIMPGVEKNAAVADNILNKRFLREAGTTYNMLAILITGMLLGALMPRMKALKAAFLFAGFIAGYAAFAQALFVYKLLWLNFIYPTGNMLVISTVLIMSKYFFEEKKAKHLRYMFSSYVSPKIVEELIRNPEKARLGGERRTITVLFSDVAGFTSLSEKLEPEGVVGILNEYFTEMTDIVFRWDGTLDKFVGDEIMAFWGAPAEQPNHAELAVRCALDMSKKLDKLHEKWKNEGKPLLTCGIGLNTGEVLIGNIGAAGKKMDYTAIGDNVNIGARVEKLTRQYNARMLLTESTVSHIKPLLDARLIGHVSLVDLASVKVKGKEKEIRIYRLTDLESKDLLEERPRGQTIITESSPP